MQQAGERGHAVELLMAHDAQIVDVAFHLAELSAEGVYLIAIAESYHPALQRVLQHDPYAAGDHRQIVEPTDLIMRVPLQHRLR